MLNTCSMLAANITNADNFILLIVLTFSAIVIVFYILSRRGYVPYVRPIAGLTGLEEAIGRATELGRPVVFAHGINDIRAIQTHVALSVLTHVARTAARLRAEFIAVVSRPDVFPITEEVVREAYRAEDALDRFRPEEQIRYLSESAEVYAASVGKLIEESPAGCAIFFGSFNFASLLMAEPGARMGVIQIAGDAGLGQIPFFVCTCDYTIMGEEYFAAGAYLSKDPGVRGAIFSQDLIKAVIAACILLGIVCYHLQHDWSWAKDVMEFFDKYK